MYTVGIIRVEQQCTCCYTYCKSVVLLLFLSISCKIIDPKTKKSIGARIRNTSGRVVSEFFSFYSENDYGQHRPCKIVLLTLVAPRGVTAYIFDEE